MMIDPEVYRHSYGLEPRILVPGAPPVFSMRGVLGRGRFWSTAPFLTDEVDLPGDAATQSAYLNALTELVHASRADYGLVKARDASWAEGLGGRRGMVVDRFVTSVLDLSVGEDVLWSQTLHRKRRAQVERGRQVGAVFRAERFEGFEAFYRVIVETQTRLGTPVHGRRFFSAILESDPDAFLLNAYVGGRVVSTALLIVRNGTLYHPFTGTLPEFFPTYLNALLYWEIIRWGLARGLAKFDLGRSFRGSGVHEFKKYWGGRDVPLYYCYLTDRGAAPSLETPFLKLATRAWSHLPLGVAERLGPHLIRGVP